MTGTKRPLDRYFDILAAGRHLSIHPDTVRRLVKQGKIPAFKFGNKWLIDKKDIDGFAKWRAQRTRPKE